jgi:hypothetical protein
VAEGAGGGGVDAGTRGGGALLEFICFPIDKILGKTPTLRNDFSL